MGEAVAKTRRGRRESRWWSCIVAVVEKWVDMCRDGKERLMVVTALYIYSPVKIRTIPSHTKTPRI